MRERPVVGVVLGVFLVVVWVGVQLSFGEWWLTALSVAVLWLSVAPFYLPTEFTLSGEKVAMRSIGAHREKPLDRYRRAVADRRGVLLSPYERRSRLDRFHGMNLRYDSPDRERVLDWIRDRLPLEVADAG